MPALILTVLPVVARATSVPDHADLHPCGLRPACHRRFHRLHGSIGPPSAFARFPRPRRSRSPPRTGKPAGVKGRAGLRKSAFSLCLSAGDR